MNITYTNKEYKGISEGDIAPSTDKIWLNGGELKKFKNGEWVSVHDLSNVEDVYVTKFSMLELMRGDAHTSKELIEAIKDNKTIVIPNTRVERGGYITSASYVEMHDPDFGGYIDITLTTVFIDSIITGTASFYDGYDVVRIAVEAKKITTKEEKAEYCRSNSGTLVIGDNRVNFRNGMCLICSDAVSNITINTTMLPSHNSAIIEEYQLLINNGGNVSLHFTENPNVTVYSPTSIEYPVFLLKIKSAYHGKSRILYVECIGYV